jgi:kynurenine formamidase
MRLVDLSHTMKSGMLVYPGDKVIPEIQRISSHGRNSHQSSALHSGCHAGTHIDLPLHFLDNEPSLEAFDLNNCRGRALRIDTDLVRITPDVLKDVDLSDLDFVVFSTGWQKKWGTEAYYRDWPHFTLELARLLARAGLKGVGLDTPSIDPFDAADAHGILATAGLINIENLANLDALPVHEFELMVLPLKLAGAEASPVRAVAVV